MSKLEINFIDGVTNVIKGPKDMLTTLMTELGDCKNVVIKLDDSKQCIMHQNITYMELIDQVHDETTSIKESLVENTKEKKK